MHVKRLHPENKNDPFPGVILFILPAASAIPGPQPFDKAPQVVHAMLGRQLHVLVLEALDVAMEPGVGRRDTDIWQVKSGERRAML